MVGNSWMALVSLPLQTSQRESSAAMDWIGVIIGQFAKTTKSIPSVCPSFSRHNLLAQHPFSSLWVLTVPHSHILYSFSRLFSCLPAAAALNPLSVCSGRLAIARLVVASARYGLVSYHQENTHGPHVCRPLHWPGIVEPRRMDS